ncbi:hypothetical protein, partial [Streptococcus thermophilus]|uniref:hypothetical protein n=1 Tax=Streptococcus thermophilus TaxID=1308 RepID=UPI0034676B11
FFGFLSTQAMLDDISVSWKIQIQGGTRNRDGNIPDKVCDGPPPPWGRQLSQKCLAQWHWFM